MAENGGVHAKAEGHERVMIGWLVTNDNVPSEANRRERVSRRVQLEESDNIPPERQKGERVSMGLLVENCNVHPEAEETKVLISGYG